MAQATSEYFKNRVRRNKKKVIDMEEKDISKLKRVYKENIKDLDKQIADFYNKYGEDINEQLTLFEVKKLKSELKKIIKENPKDIYLKKKLKDIIPKYKIDRLEELKTQIHMQFTAITAIQEAQINDTIVKSGVLTSELNKIMFDRVGMYGLNAINAKKIDIISRQKWINNKNWSERVWGNRAHVGAKVEKLLQTGLTQGKPLQTISKQLKEATGNTYNNSFRLIRTEASFVSNQVTVESYQELELERYEYDAIMDNLTSQICKDLDGQIFLLSESQVGVNTPPMHPSCRSTILPLLN